MSEQWKMIPNWESYEVSDIGRVRRRVAGGNWPAGRLLMPAMSDTGHLYVMLSVNNRAKKQYIHRLVLTAFVEPQPFEGAMALHRDDVPSNNWPDNLYWGTKLNNYEDRVRNRGWDRKKTAARGSASPRALLSEGDIPAIRQMRQRGLKLREIASNFNVHIVTVSDVLRGKTWSHV